MESKSKTQKVEKKKVEGLGYKFVYETHSAEKSNSPNFIYNSD